MARFTKAASVLGARQRAAPCRKAPCQPLAWSQQQPRAESSVFATSMAEAARNTSYDFPEKASSVPSAGADWDGNGKPPLAPNMFVSCTCGWWPCHSPVTAWLPIISCRTPALGLQGEVRGIVWPPLQHLVGRLCRRSAEGARKELVRVGESTRATVPSIAWCLP